MLEQIDPDQRRRQLLWQLEEELPEPTRFAQLMAEFMEQARLDLDIDLDDPSLSEAEVERLNRLLADESALIEMMRRTERLRLEVRRALRVSEPRERRTGLVGRPRPPSLSCVGATIQRSLRCVMMRWRCMRTVAPMRRW